MMMLYLVEFADVGGDASWCGGQDVQGGGAKARRMKWSGELELLVGRGSRVIQNYCI
jgi:hypothetical protein